MRQQPVKKCCQKWCEHVHVLLYQACRHQVSRRLLVEQLADSSDNVVSGQLIELVQRATCRCSCVPWRRCPVLWSTHTGDFVIQLKLKLTEAMVKLAGLDP